MSSESSPLFQLEKFFSEKQEKVSTHVLQEAFQAMHIGYTSGKHEEMKLRSIEEVYAYIVVRRPATSKSVERVLCHLQELLPHFAPQSLVDIGSGPLTVFQSVLASFEKPLESALFVESHPLFCKVIEDALHALSSPEEKSRYTLVQSDMTLESTYHKIRERHDRYDMATMSYSLGEVGQESISSVVKGILSISNCIVIIEPGTPRGWKRLMEARDIILEDNDWRLIAPCPHRCTCPFVGTSEWCHETVRVSRSSALKQIKLGSLGYEDEPFSYLIASRNSLHDSSTKCYSRIVHRPQHRSGHSHFTLCTPEGSFSEITVSRKDKELYRMLKKAEWGDIVPMEKSP